MDQIRTMKMFRRVVELSGFAAAAAELDIDGATMSRQIAQLERELGARLLVRSTRKISPTAAGRLYYEGCLRTLEAFETTRKQVVGLSKVPRGPLRINAPMSFGIVHIAPLISRFLAQYQGTRIELCLDDRVIDVIGKGFDMAIRIRNELPESGLNSRRIAHIRRTIVAAPSYLRRRGTPRTPEELSAHACIEYSLASSPPGNWDVTDTNGSDTRVPVRSAFQVNNSLAMVPALIDGVGIGLVPRFIVRDAIEKGDLIELLRQHHPRPHLLFAVHAQGRLMSASLRAFSMLFREEMNLLEAGGAL